MVNNDYGAIVTIFCLPAVFHPGEDITAQVAGDTLDAMARVIVVSHSDFSGRVDTTAQQAPLPRLTVDEPETGSFDQCLAGRQSAG